MGPKMIASQYLSDPASRVYIAFDKKLENTVGHAFYKVFAAGPFKKVVWITQLVVHSDHRGKQIAQTLLHSALGTECDCAGLVSSHPHAVLALEKAMGAKCCPIMIKAYAEVVLSTSGIGYLQDKPIIVDGTHCVVNTDFPVDHAEPLAALATLGCPWHLGDLPDAHEFLAIVFKV